MAREDLHFRLRIPDDLKAKVMKSAEANHRSITSEIIARLESSFDERNHILPEGLADLVKSAVREALEAHQDSAPKASK